VRGEIQFREIKAFSGKRGADRMTESQFAHSSREINHGRRQDRVRNQVAGARIKTREPPAQRKTPNPDAWAALRPTPSGQGMKIGERLLCGAKHCHEIV
jgi:hypothetical protein